jgi:hypothetical protein
VQIVANFGASPFKGDVDSIMAAASQNVELQISSSVIPSDKKVILPAPPALPTFADTGRRVRTLPLFCLLVKAPCHDA